ncbi:hypothetical protein PHYBLDRAFT_63514 [Phycomyces blakesleeanus NRRL 1555(-)]|uniref:Transposase domain-containing protein n=1 Tax=Phycomyces blakesleeanus (strain ATCC 8743b / DSM 1359 / FGSC 10004 / NBRC 33097 / NRRL 1555) TaxID=763407 RepID=A0A167KPJ3_PHYB8|nr:hypothetical protein PHYBLDRAFT_63514 [Phycomyces blakesleeanus NRRL 1555(-)]OAD68578.1 hypothetical protein PHYBLDRAFT_63514 [Phycomyces blakesleeanus NRRL 1555(-)]|eukprot:XP_018286618.1 hypothetical protein PHYBLDRAFT_63514 [Phycomyces blakesleeanus NRRL 1555(-)]
MFPSIQMHNTDCHCIRCNNNDQGVSRVSRCTAQHHNKRARFEAEKRSMEVDTEIIPMYQSDSVEAMDGQTNSPILDAVSTFDNDVFVGNDYNGDESDTTDDNDSNENGEEDTAEIYVEEFNNEDPFTASGMPENPVHRFIATFTVLFASCYVVNKGSVVLIEFINELLKIYGQDFQLPKSLAGIYKMTGFSSITKDIKRFVSCPNCHCIYEENMSVPPHCVFTNVGARSPCDCKLMKESTSGALVSKQAYLYQSLKQALSVLFLRPGFEEQIRHWNTELKIVDTMCDIYDGAMWKELKDASGVSFVACPRSLMLTLNIDWFQPFDGVSYSSGAIYLVVRFKPENTILVGLMPGPKEPRCEEINNYLKLMVDKMKQLYVGILPNTNQVDFSGFDYLLWNICSSVENRLHAEEWKSASTPSERHQLEVEYGVRWSQLQRLGYFDLVRGTIIDLMHNLFLETPKRMMDWWVDKKTIGAKEFAAMEKIAETMVLLRDYTKLTSKTGKGFPYMKADDWKSWVLVYSPVLLHGVLPFEIITFDEVNSTHDYLEMFCKKATKLYTPTILTCNMHLHLHLRETIRVFGPMYGCWLFGFERYNGLLKHIKTNGKDSFEATYMRSFLQNAFKGDYANAVLKTSSNPHFPPKGNEPLPPSTFPLQLKKSLLMDETDCAHLLQHYKTSYDLPNLVSYQYATLTNSFVDNEITKLKFIDLLGQQYCGKNGSASCGSLVHVMFVGSDSTNTLAYAEQIQYLFTHSFTHPSYSNLYLTRMVHDH